MYFSITSLTVCYCERLCYGELACHSPPLLSVFALSLAVSPLTAQKLDLFCIMADFLFGIFVCLVGLACLLGLLCSWIQR